MHLLSMAERLAAVLRDVRSFAALCPKQVEVASVSAQPAAGVEFLDKRSSLPRPALLRKGDIFTSVFRIRGISEQHLASLGQLLVTWKRRR